jgi:hypothetical protein
MFLDLFILNYEKFYLNRKLPEIFWLHLYGEAMLPPHSCTLCPWYIDRSTSLKPKYLFVKKGLDDIKEFESYKSECYNSSVFHLFFFGHSAKSS